jgi:acyl-CoA synthetase (NDP forming)
MNTALLGCGSPGGQTVKGGLSLMEEGTGVGQGEGDMPDMVEALEAMFNARSVAVVGATDNEDKLGFHILRSLTRGEYPGNIFPINPGKREILGMRSYPSLMDVPDKVDLCVISLPARLVPGIIRSCAEKGVKGIILITAGFREIEDESGKRLQDEIMHLADEAGIPVIGPNTFGIVNLYAGLNASFTPQFSDIERGGISLLSQSGGMSHLMGFLSMRDDFGFSKIVGLGNRCNVDFAEMIPYLMQDPDTRVIAMYMEGIDKPRRLLEVARKFRGKKPMVAYKVGLSPLSDLASRSHTGSIAGRHELYEAGFRQAGILTVESSSELLDTAKALSFSPLPVGCNVAVLSGQAGPGMAACDICAREGLHIAAFSEGTQRRINSLLPPMAMRTNPVDMGPAWYDSGAIRGIVESALADTTISAVILCIMFASANEGSIRALSDVLKKWGRTKPIVCCFSSPSGIWEDEVASLLGTGSIINYATPERAAKALSALWKYANMRGHG